MVATLAQAASASYYLESQRSFRHPNEYYTAGEEPDGVWFNPKGLLGLENGGKVDSSDFQRLYNGFAPDGSKLAHQERGQRPALAGCGHDVLGRQERVRALGHRRSRAPVPDRGSAQRRRPGGAGRDRVPLLQPIRVSGTGRGGSGSCLPISRWRCSSTAPAGRTTRSFIPTASSSTSARTREDGKWRAMHQYPVYSWAKAAGALYRNALAWDLQRGPRYLHGAVRSQQRVHPHAPACRTI